MPVLERDRRAALDAEERVFWTIVMSAATSLSVVVALAAAHRQLTRCWSPTWSSPPHSPRSRGSI
jgi:hypothetical protein